MIFEWDNRKDEANQIKHGVGFESARRFHWETALVVDRSRVEDGESRYAAIGILGQQLHTVVFTKRGASVRIISLRRSNSTEERAYEKARQKIQYQS